MALQSSGAISLNDIQTEFGGTNPISLSEYYRNGSYVTSNNTNVPTSGAISIGNFYGAVLQFQHTITSNQQNLDLDTYLTNVGWNGSDPVGLTINSGVYIWTDTTSTAALIISSALSNKLIITHNGFIMGKGGNGGYRADDATAGGPAISNSASGVSCYLGSSGYIGGGGGGGAGSMDDGGGDDQGHGGGGAGGGNGGGQLSGRLGGTGGAIGEVGGNGGSSWTQGGFGGGAGGGGGSADEINGGGGGGGGRIMPGTGGAGGDGIYDGGAGGSAGNPGSDQATKWGGAGGGGWGAAGGKTLNYNNTTYWYGGAGGKAVTGTAISFYGSTSNVYGANG